MGARDEELARRAAFMDSKRENRNTSFGELSDWAGWLSVGQEMLWKKQRARRFEHRAASVNLDNFPNAPSPQPSPPMGAREKSWRVVRFMDSKRDGFIRGIVSRHF